MGTGESGRYYTSHGSRRVHHGALIHSFDGKFSHNARTGKPQKLKSGGHGQTAIEIMQKNGIEFHIVKTYPNGVRIGNIPDSRQGFKRSKTGMAWFPKNWSQKDMTRAGEHVTGLKKNRNAKNGETVWGTWKGVRVGVIKTNGQIATIFPDSRYQPSPRKKKK